MKNSEVFDAYAAVMNQFIQKRASAASAFMKEIPGFADELAGAASVVATKSAVNSGEEFVALWKTVYKADYGEAVKFVEGADDILDAAADPRLADPAFVSSVIEQLTIVKKQADKFTEYISLPTNDAQREYYQYATREFPDAIDEIIQKWTAHLGEAQAAAAAGARAATDPAGEAGQRAAREGLQEGAEELGEAGAREGLQEGAEELGEAGAREGLGEAADIAAGPAAKATETITELAGDVAAPVAKQEVETLTTGAKELGNVEGMKEGLEAAIAASGRENAEAIAKVTESLEASIAALRSELAEQIGRSTDEVAAAGGEAVANNARRLDGIEAAFTDLVQEVRKLAKDAAKAGGNAVPDTARGAASTGFREWIRSSMAGGAAWAGVKLEGKIALGAAAFGGLVYLGMWLLKDDERVAAYEAELSRLHQAILNATAAHKALQFNELTNGGEQNEDLLQELDDNKDSARILSAQNLSNPDSYDSIVAASEQLDELDAEVREFTATKDRIVGDLTDSNGWEAALAADQELIQAIGRVNSAMQRAIQEAERNGQGGSSSGQRDDGQGGSNGDPSASGPIGEGDGEGRVILDMYGEQIDITGKPAGFRSAAPRMARKLLNNPYGMAFVDPHDRWGGFIRKTGRPQVDYLNALGYLYKEGVFTPGQLRRFIRHAIPKQGRRRHSGWKNAVKYYRRHPVSHKTASNILITESLVKESTNRSDIGMRKMADQYPNKYISDAISGLSDQYAKTYYAGLKSQYNTSSAKPRADYKELYEIHGEKGSDLIQAAHPEAIVVSDSMGNGGLVENLLEQKSHSEGVAKSAPTGNFRGKHANLEVIEALNKLANQADKAGFFEVSDLIDSTITTILNE